MRNLYHSTSKPLQVAEYRKAAEECEKAGFKDFAAVNREMAAILTPRPPRVDRTEKDEDSND